MRTKETFERTLIQFGTAPNYLHQIIPVGKLGYISVEVSHDGDAENPLSETGGYGRLWQRGEELPTALAGLVAKQQHLIIPVSCYNHSSLRWFPTQHAPEALQHIEWDVTKSAGQWYPDTQLIETIQHTAYQGVYPGLVIETFYEHARRKGEVKEPVADGWGIFYSGVVQVTGGTSLRVGPYASFDEALEAWLTFKGRGPLTAEEIVFGEHAVALQFAKAGCEVYTQWINGDVYYAQVLAYVDYRNDPVTRMGTVWHGQLPGVIVRDSSMGAVYGEEEARRLIVLELPEAETAVHQHYVTILPQLKERLAEATDFSAVLLNAPGISLEGALDILLPQLDRILTPEQVRGLGHHLIETITQHYAQSQFEDHTPEEDPAAGKHPGSAEGGVQTHGAVVDVDARPSAETEGT